jgi:hypothetical protein
VKKRWVRNQHYAQTDEWMLGVGKLHGCTVLAVVAGAVACAIGGCIAWIK